MWNDTNNRDIVEKEIKRACRTAFKVLQVFFKYVFYTRKNVSLIRRVKNYTGIEFHTFVRYSVCIAWSHYAVLNLPMAVWKHTYTKCKKSHRYDKATYFYVCRYLKTYRYFFNHMYILNHVKLPESNELWAMSYGTRFHITWKSHNFVISRSVL